MAWLVLIFLNAFLESRDIVNFYHFRVLPATLNPRGENIHLDRGGLELGPSLGKRALNPLRHGLLGNSFRFGVLIK